MHEYYDSNDNQIYWCNIKPLKLLSHIENSYLQDNEVKINYKGLVLPVDEFSKTFYDKYKQQKKDGLFVGQFSTWAFKNRKYILSEMERRYDLMREWKFENGIEVYEVRHDYDLHAFKVYNVDEYLGTVYPSSISDMEECIRQLDDGIDPISGDWEDGCGNPCTLDGWSVE